MIEVPTGWKQIIKRPIKSSDCVWNYGDEKFCIVANFGETLNMMVRNEDFHSLIIIRKEFL